MLDNICWLLLVRIQKAIFGDLTILDAVRRVLSQCHSAALNHKLFYRNTHTRNAKAALHYYTEDWSPFA